jgi:hydroxymethylbilane synthase
MEDRIAAPFPLQTILPAVSQGAIGIQLRADDEGTASWVAPLDHPETRGATNAERALLRILEGGCQVPVGALGEVEGDTLLLRAVVCSLDGRRAVEGSRSAPAEQAVEVGVALGKELLDRGGAEILEAIRKVELGS